MIENATALQSRQLTATLYSAVTILPMRPSPDSALRFSAGAMDMHGNPLDAFSLKRSWGSSGVTMDTGTPRQNHEGDFIYGGVIFNHYGHFLLETLARNWFIRLARHDMPIVWHSFMSLSNLSGWQKEIFGLIGIDISRILIAKQSSRIERCICPDPGYFVQTWADDAHAKSLTVIRQRSGAKTKIWLSRSRLDSENGRVINEDDLEVELERLGWTIFHAQEFSVKDQLEVLSGAEHIAGFEGSALHTLILLETRARITIFRRNNNPLNQNFVTISIVKQLDQTIISPPLAKISGSGAKTSSEILDLEFIIESLR